MASSDADDRVKAARDKLRASLAKLCPEVRRAIAESARKKLKELDDPDSELSKGIKRDIGFIFDVVEKLKGLPSNRSRARALAEIVRRSRKCPKPPSPPQ